jgi:hypothetical protein
LTAESGIDPECRRGRNPRAWAETADKNGFKKHLGTVKEEIDRQRAIVEADDAEHEFRDEITKLRIP